MFFLCPEQQQGLPNASSSRAIIIDTPQVVVSSCKPPSPSPLPTLLLTPSSAGLFTFVIVAVVLNLASYCLAVSVAVAVPVRVPGSSRSLRIVSTACSSIKEDHKKNRKQWATRATRGGNCCCDCGRGSKGEGGQNRGGSARDAVVMLPSHCLAGFTQIPAGSGSNSNSGSSSINHRRATAWRGRSCLSCQCPMPVRDQSECQFQYIAHVFLFSFYLRSDTL